MIFQPSGYYELVECEPYYRMFTAILEYWLWLVGSKVVVRLVVCLASVSGPLVTSSIIAQLSSAGRPLTVSCAGGERERESRHTGLGWAGDTNVLHLH